MPVSSSFLDFLKYIAYAIHNFANFRREIPFALISACKLSVNAIQISTPFPAKRWYHNVC
nr:MAG TPA: hypothetical protein [Caudoviricetes sp.]